MRKRLFIVVLLVILFSSGVFAVKFANDPTSLSIGARPLGIGRAFISIADDPSAIFLNPAGLTQLKNWEIASMAGKFINIYDYVELSGAYPTEYGTFGIGYGGSATEFRFPSSEVIVIGGEVRIVPTGEVTGRYANTAMLLSFAREQEIFGYQNVSLGASLKLLSQDLSASNISGGTASGVELNVGGLYPVNDNLRVAMTAENILPQSMGGGIKWTTGQEESLPAVLKTGVSYDFLQGELMQEEKERWLTLTADYDHHVTQSAIPGLLHAGVEWLPLKFLAVRAGLDQSWSSDQSSNIVVSNDLTFGVGVIWRGFKFDYAYHTYNNLPDNTTNYFSFSYVHTPGDIIPFVPGNVKMTAPVDGAVVYDESIVLQGRVLDRSVSAVAIDGNLVMADANGNFMAEFPLELGTNVFTIMTFDQDKQLLKQVPWTVVRLMSFKDVEAGYWAKLPIEQLATLKIISGYPDATFRPKKTINRAELVTLIMRMVGVAKEGGPGPKFTDVPNKHWASQYISEAVKQGIVTGYPDKTFRPSKPVTRAEGVAIIARYAQLPLFDITAAPYKDVPGRHWAAKAITAARDAGYLDYLKEDFGLKADLSRGEVAYILAKTQLVKQQIDKLMGK